MIIVVEGPDNAGKTTLALDIAKKMQGVFVKVERPRGGISLKALSELLDVATRYSGVVVTDRHACISEPIYGKIIRGGHDLDEREVLRCYDQINAIVYCRPPTHVIMGSLGERPQMEGVLDHTPTIIHAYDELMLELHMEQEKLVKVYDYQKHNPQELIENLIKYKETYRL